MDKGYKTLVISAFPCCGKTYATKHYDEIKPCEPFYDSSTKRTIYPDLEKKDKIKPNEIIDLDSSNYSHFYTGIVKEKNIDFPENYISKIKELIGNVKIIFVSSHLEVREAMDEAGIEFITVYPSLESKAEWLGRMVMRDQDLEFIHNQRDYWEDRITKIQNEVHGVGVFFLHGERGNIINLLNDVVVSVEYDKRKYDENTTNPVIHHINKCVNNWVNKF